MQPLRVMRPTRLHRGARRRGVAAKIPQPPELSPLARSPADARMLDRLAAARSSGGLSQRTERIPPRGCVGGEVPERLNGLVSKTRVSSRASGVRIPPSPPFLFPPPAVRMHAPGLGRGLRVHGLPRARQLRAERVFGEVSEWLKEHAWKACVSVSPAPWVQIPPSPPRAAAAWRGVFFRGEFSASAFVGPVLRDGSLPNRVRPGTEQP